MYIWPDGSVTGSVNHAVLDAYNKAKEEGGDLSEFALYLAAPGESSGSILLKMHQQAARIDEQIAELVTKPEPEAAEESAAPVPAGEPSAYDGWTLAELTEEAESRGLPKYGTKADIAERLSENDAAETGTDEEL